jgi:hypothetical protein
MRMFYGWSAAWAPGPSPSVGQPHHKSREDRRPRVKDHRLRHVRQAARRSTQRHRRRGRGDDHHLVAAPQRRLPLQQSAVVLDVSPARFAGRRAAAQAANVEGQPTRSRDHSRTVIDLDLSPSSAMSWRTATSLWRRQVNGATAERPNCGRASASAAVRRDHRAQISASSGVATR